MKELSLLNPNIPTKASDCLHWGQLPGASAALAISAAAQKNSGPLVLITNDMLNAARFEHELKFFCDKQFPIFIFPDWETLPYDNFSPHQDLISQRLLTLYQLPNLQQGILIVSINTLMTRLAPRGYIEANSFVLAKGDRLILENFRQRLESHGYRNVAQVMEHGEFATRGSIIDLYPMGSQLPFRIDLFGDEVDSIRTFDPETQRTIQTIEKINLLPAREFPLTEDAISLFRQNWRAKFTGNPLNSPIYQSISQGESAAGIEYYLPLFFDKTSTLFDYLPTNSLLITQSDIYNTANKVWSEIEERYEQLRYDQIKPILPPAEIFLHVEQIFAEIKKFSQVRLYQEPLSDKAGHINFATKPFPDLTIDRKAENPLIKLQSFLKNINNSTRILFCAETIGRRESLIELLKPIVPKLNSVGSWQEFLTSHDEYLAITIAILEEGLYTIDPAIIVIGEAQLFEQQVMQRRLRKRTTQDPEAIVRDLTELSIGAPVVHIDHGVGLYQGLQIIKTGDIEAEYLTLEYANNAKLYVPVSSLHLISRYTGMDAEHTILHQLGSKQWEKTRQKAAEKIRDVAAELLDLYAHRAAKVGHAFTLTEKDFEKFSAAFPFEETPDQQQAIAAVMQDMTSSRIMDRLVCGDVGFGKTEVAMRAAFLAAHAGKQVAVLVPTTLLAEQHYQTFKDRFADWPIKIAAISRFQTGTAQNKILEDLKNGNVDIIIGTHKLLQTNIKFKSLGLLIIDEEHRFGVQQKERIKSLRNEVDILALTATPIPRTLNMALASMRDLSIIATPPARRLAVKTFVSESSASLIREAIMREILRGGQVYFVHNDIATIARTARELNELIPEARIGIAHGQMHERELAQAMADFYHLRFNVLVCTTIIESGIDIPTANTIIIDRADRFGLAQLHQLRGRVGRSHHQAYAYLLIPSRKVITTDAIKRLDAIASLENLGAGFMLATHDLEIRGAGELLGEEQSGHIQAIGFSLYMELLDLAVKALKEGKEPDLVKPLTHGVEIDLHIPALIPEIFIGDVHIRLTLYKRIANAKTADELKELQIEIIDRFGLLPEATKNLFRIAELRIKAEPLGIRKIDIGPKSGKIEFAAEPNIDLKQLLKLIQTQPLIYKLDSQQRLNFVITDEEPESRFAIVETLIDKLKKSTH